MADYDTTASRTDRTGTDRIGTDRTGTDRAAAGGSRLLTGIIIAALIAVAAYFFMAMPDRRSTGDRVGDAVDSASQGNLEDAARSLEDRTPAERAGDALRETGRDVERAVQ